MELGCCPPTILLACLNTFPKNDHTVRQLRERRTVACLFEDAEDQAMCQLVHVNFSTQSNCESTWDEHFFNEDARLLFINGKLEGAAAWDVFQKLVLRWPRLQAICIHGQIPLKVIESLLLRDIPAIIAYESPRDTETIPEGIHAFFSSLAEGTSVMEAFQSAPAHIARMRYSAHYDFESDALLWDAQPEAAVEVPVLYYLRENTPRLHDAVFEAQVETLASNLPVKSPVSASSPEMPAQELSTQGQVERQGEEKEPKQKAKNPSKTAPNLQAEQSAPERIAKPGLSTKQRGKERTNKNNGKLKKGVGTSLLGLILSTSILLLMGYIEKRDTWSSCPIAETDSLGYHLRVFPITEKHQCKGSLVQPMGFLNHRLLHGQQRNLHLHVSKIEACKLKEEDFFSRHPHCHNDILVWGETEQISSQETELTLYAFPSQELDERDTLIMNYTTDIAPAQLQGMLKDSILKLTGAHLFRRGAYEEAVEVLSQIPNQPTRTYLLIDQLLANAYTKLGAFNKAQARYAHILRIDSTLASAYNGRGNIAAHLEQPEQAIFNFKQAISYDPDYASAYFNLGLLLLKQGDYELARENLHKVLTLEPYNGDAYGVLAAIYAEQRISEDFYKNLEAALQAGMRIETFLAYTAIGDYKNEPQFQALLAQYTK